MYLVICNEARELAEKYYIKVRVKCDVSTFKFHSDPLILIMMRGLDISMERNNSSLFWNTEHLPHELSGGGLRALVCGINSLGSAGQF